VSQQIKVDGSTAAATATAPPYGTAWLTSNYSIVCQTDGSLLAIIADVLSLSYILFKQSQFLPLCVFVVVVAGEVVN